MYPPPYIYHTNQQIHLGILLYPWDPLDPPTNFRGAKLHAYNAGQVVIHTAGDTQKE